MKTLPEVSVSNPAMQCRSVDFPDPDGPITAVNPLAVNSTVIPSRARTAASPVP